MKTYYDLTQRELQKLYKQYLKCEFAKRTRTKEIISVSFAVIFGLLGGMLEFIGEQTSIAILYEISELAFIISVALFVAAIIGAIALTIGHFRWMSINKKIKM